MNIDDNINSKEVYNNKTNISNKSIPNVNIIKYSRILTKMNQRNHKKLVKL